jgi:flavin-dependent dehydrogenase
VTAPDVIVIGGGPAGSSSAIRLARAGRHVRLYEKSIFPRQKLCGGFLSPEALNDLDELSIFPSLRRCGVISLHRTVIASTRGAIIESPLPEEALSVSRDILDDLLLQEARRAGTEVLQGEDGSDHTEEAPFTVIATGRMGTAREQIRHGRLTPWYASPSTPYIGLQALFQNVHGISDQVELDLVESGYVGLARQPHGVNVCTLTTPDLLKRYGPSLDNVMAHFATENPVLGNHLNEASRISGWMTIGPVRLGIRQLAHGSTFYIGDAACVVDPFAGEGMSISLYSSQLLQKALDQAEKPAAKAYEDLWREAFMPALRWNAVMRMLYSVPFIREPAMRTLQWFPQGMNWLTDLTRYRRLESL